MSTRINNARSAANTVLNQWSACGYPPDLPIVVVNTIKLLAEAVLELADDCESLSRVLDSRTEHLV